MYYLITARIFHQLTMSVNNNSTNFVSEYVVKEECNRIVITHLGVRVPSEDVPTLFRNIISNNIPTALEIQFDNLWLDRFNLSDFGSRLAPFREEDIADRLQALQFSLECELMRTTTLHEPIYTSRKLKCSNTIWEYTLINSIKVDFLDGIHEHLSLCKIRNPVVTMSPFSLQELAAVAFCTHQQFFSPSVSPNLFKLLIDLPVFNHRKIKISSGIKHDLYIISLRSVLGERVINDVLATQGVDHINLNMVRFLNSYEVHQDCDCMNGIIYNHCQQLDCIVCEFSKLIHRKRNNLHIINGHYDYCSNKFIQS